MIYIYIYMVSTCKNYEEFLKQFFYLLRDFFQIFEQVLGDYFQRPEVNTPYQKPKSSCTT